MNRTFRSLLRDFAASLIAFTAFILFSSVVSATPPQDSVSADEIIDSILEIKQGRLVLRDQHLPYLLKDTLFTDFAHKMRSIYMPPGSGYKVLSSGEIEYPVGTIISKTFYYPKEIQSPCDIDKDGTAVQLSYQQNSKLVSSIDLSKNCLVETRVLIKESSGWIPYGYKWNGRALKADYVPGGGRVAFSGVHADGRRELFDYWIPSIPQCHSCHEGTRYNADFKPLGPIYQRLDRNASVNEGDEFKQMAAWRSRWKEERAATTIHEADSGATKSNKIRDYLDVNCGHCHNPNGLAASSGLYLDRYEKDAKRYGVCKRPVATGDPEYNSIRYDIAPGDVVSSYLYQRLVSIDAQNMMPELGRVLIDESAVKKIQDWIESLEGHCEQVEK